MGLFSKSRHARLMMSVAVGALTLGAGTAYAQARPITIESQSLASALHDFGAQTGRQILFTPESAKSKTTRGVDGATDEQIALTQLLEGTGLTFRREANVYLIERADDPQSGSAAGGGAEVEALIVTAQKREEDIQDVPIAMSAFSQEQLETHQIAGGPDLMTQVPNMTFTKTNFTSYSIQLRGIGTQAISATTDAAVAVAFNNTPFIRNRFFEQEFYDLQRVEVLRGPQGTLYGRNATAGVVNVISQKPAFAYQAKVSGDISNYSSSRLEGMVNIPLVDDRVALRIASAWTKREGYSTNQLSGNPIDGRDLWSTRLSLRFAPTDNIDANLIWEHFEENDDRLRSGKQLCKTHEVTNVAGFETTHYQALGEYGLPQLFSGVQASFSQGCTPSSLYSPDSFETPNGLSLPYFLPLGAIGLPINTGGGGNVAALDPYVSRTQSHDLRVIESMVDPQYEAESDVVELQLNFDLPGNLSVASETGYSVDTIFSTQDYNRFNTAPGMFAQPDMYYDRRENLLLPGPNGGIFCDPQLGCADRLVAMDLSTARSRQFSQEFRLSSDYDGPFNFNLGANFLRYDTEDKYYVFINTLSLYAAKSNYSSGGSGFRGPMPPYEPGVSDNHECLKNGFLPPDARRGYDVLGCIYMDPNSVHNLNDRGHNYFLSKNPYKLMSYALFGEVYYQFTENLKLTAGLRWTVDKKEAPRIPSWILAADTVGYPVAEVINQKWEEPTGRLALDWKPALSFTDETLLYASYAHGYKAGGSNPPAAGIVCAYCAGANANDLASKSPTHPKTFDPEFVDAFELGAKNTLLDGKLTVNAAAFYYDYRGYQISQIVDRAAINYNFDAQVWGLELESDWRPLDNLRLGLKLGYENTKVADGMKAIDVMDRTAGDPNWLVYRPFPTLPSNCVLPTWLFIGNPQGWGSGDTNPALVNVGGKGGGNLGGCELAYVKDFDPATGLEYRLFPFQDPGNIAGEFFRENTNYAGWSTDMADYPCWPAGVPLGTEYPGVDPECLAAMSNNGEGFFKDLSGNQLPNAPSMTATITADYTVPLPRDWLMTLHTDLYYQSEAWTRIFNTEGYDRLKAYSNINLAAIFTNEDAGWKVMAYVKNVLDRDSITGAFLNSDDTGLTTNVFLTEPRLYGLRVTKEWNGGPWWTGAGANHTGPYPLTVEIGGQIQRQYAPYQDIAAQSLANLPEPLRVGGIQNRDLDRGDGRSLKLTWRPEASPWSVSAAVRYGRTNSDTTRVRHELETAKVCGWPDTTFYGYPIDDLACDPASPKYNPFVMKSATNWSDAEARSREKHQVIDFRVGRDFGIGSGLDSTLSAGLRRVNFESTTEFAATALTGWDIPQGWIFESKYSAGHYGQVAHITSEREFEGFGPTLTWDAATHLLGNADTGEVRVDWSLTAGALFGKQKTAIEDKEEVGHYVGAFLTWPAPIDGEPTVIDKPVERSSRATVPMFDLSLGLAYEIQRVKVGAGYRWERYFDVLDAGFGKARDYDRAIDGPYFRVSVGFGG